MICHIYWAPTNLTNILNSILYVYKHVCLEPHQKISRFDIISWEYTFYLSYKRAFCSDSRNPKNPKKPQITGKCPSFGEKKSSEISIFAVVSYAMFESGHFRHAFRMSLLHSVIVWTGFLWWNYFHKSLFQTPHVTFPSSHRLHFVCWNYFQTFPSFALCIPMSSLHPSLSIPNFSPLHPVPISNSTSHTTTISPIIGLGLSLSGS